MQIQSLSWEDSMEEGTATHSKIHVWKIHEQRSLVGYSPWGHKRIRHDLATALFSTMKRHRTCRLAYSLKMESKLGRSWLSSLTRGTKANTFQHVASPATFLQEASG